ncbi:MAG TPA: ABC transporter ATP-binding protein [Nitrospirota bacterium]
MGGSVINSNAVLETKGLSKRYGDRWAVKGLDLVVPRGEVFGFLGPNGAGKTTTIRMMLGLIAPTSGSVLINGLDAHRDPLRALAGVGAIVETPSFYGYLTGRQNLELLGKVSGGVPHGRVDEVLELAGLLTRAEDRVKGYSQGMRQRLGIAQTLLSSPEIIILDEPTNGLDPSGMREMRGLIRRLADEFGITVFVSSHLLHEVEAACTRVAVISSGTLVAQGLVTELLKSETVRLDIKVSDAAGAADVLGKLGFVSGLTDAGGGALSMDLTSGRVAEVNRALVTAGVEVSSLVPHTASLEEFFMELTGGASGDGPVTPGEAEDADA